jgi:Tfp pilus assembly protein PilV
MKFILMPNKYPPYLQRGVTLIEALAALLVMSFGMVALINLTTTLRLSSDLGRQRAQAMRLAENEISKLRSFSVLTKDASATDVVDFDTDIVSAGPSYVTPDNSNTTFTVTRTVTGASDAAAVIRKQVDVTVTWVDRAGVSGGNDPARRVTLSTIVARTDPAFAGAVAVAPLTSGVRLPSNRNPAVPVGAKNLGGGISAFQPSSGSAAVWVFNNATGAISGLCELTTSQTISTLSSSDVSNCKSNTTALLISGTIRFSRTNPAVPNPINATAADIKVAPVTVYLAPTPSEFVYTVGRRKGELVDNYQYPVDPPYTCFTDEVNTTGPAPSFLNYNCIVYPNNQSPRNWWGRLLVSGLPLGSTSADYRVCRYSADYNGNGYVYRKTVGVGRLPTTWEVDNEEHPALYSGVTTSLARQNFLIVRGDVSCPAAPAVNPTATTPVFVDYSTVQLQP